MIETRNLKLIPFERAHIEAFQRGRDELAALLQVNLPSSWPQFPEQFDYSPAELESELAWSAYFYIHEADKTLVGSGGFKGAPDRAGTVEIGYEIAREFWNRGYASEAARGLVDFAFTHADVQTVSAHTVAALNASGKVLQNIGLRFDYAIMDLEEGWMWRWHISRADYEQRGTLSEITYKTDCDGINWGALNQRLKDDHFDNGRTDAQLRLSFENSARVVFAMRDGEVIGKARALSDGVCNAYIVDVWTFTPYRKQGIARHMLDCLLDGLPGQHAYLFTDDAVDFYEKMGWERQGVGLYKMSGEWLQNETREVR